MNRPQPRSRRPRRPVDEARAAALAVLRAVNGNAAYANLALADELRERQLSSQDAGLATELVSGTCRLQGTYDRIIEAAAGRKISTLQPAVVDVLRLASHQLLSMRVPTHAAVSTSVDLAGTEIGERVTGVVNAIVRKIAADDLDGWVERLSASMGERGALVLRTHHPRWIVDAWADVLPAQELQEALEADNVAALPMLAVRPGLASVDELDGAPARWSPWGATRAGNPADVPAVRQGRAGVQDEGSQLMPLALSRVPVDDDRRWLDLCSGPGGKSGLLAGLAGERHTWLLSNERQPHRAALVSSALRRYPRSDVTVIAADGTRPPWRPGSFSRVLADVPCTGLGALRRRPESRWRRNREDLAELIPLQRALLDSAIEACAPGGVIAYVTCSPHRSETVNVVHHVADDRVEILDAPNYLSEVDGAASHVDPRFIQLWPHRHRTDAMFCALLRRR